MRFVRECNLSTLRRWFLLPFFFFFFDRLEKNRRSLEQKWKFSRAIEHVLAVLSAVGGVGGRGGREFWWPIPSIPYGDRDNETRGVRIRNGEWWYVEIIEIILNYSVTFFAISTFFLTRRGKLDRERERIIWIGSIEYFLSSGHCWILYWFNNYRATCQGDILFLCICVTYWRVFLVFLLYLPETGNVCYWQISEISCNAGNCQLFQETLNFVSIKSFFVGSKYIKAKVINCDFFFFYQHNFPIYSRYLTPQKQNNWTRRKTRQLNIFEKVFHFNKYL